MDVSAKCFFPFMCDGTLGGLALDMEEKDGLDDLEAKTDEGFVVDINGS